MTLTHCKMKIRDLLVNYLEWKVEKAKDRTIYFKEPEEYTVWIFVGEDDRDFREIKVYGLSWITRWGFVWPNDILSLEDVIKVLFKVWFGRKKK